MTNEEKQEIVNEVLAALHTHGKTIDQLTPITSPSDTDIFELSGGRSLSYGRLKERFSAILTTALGDYVPAETLSNYIEQYLAKLDTNGALDWQESPLVLLHTMGSTLDNVDGELPAYTLQEGEMFYRNDASYQIFKKLSDHEEGLPAKTGVVYFNLRTWRTYQWTGSMMEEISKPKKRVVLADLHTQAYPSMEVGTIAYNPIAKKIVEKVSSTSWSLSDPDPDCIYCDAQTGTSIRWDTANSTWLSIGGAVDVITSLNSDDSTKALAASSGAVLKQAIITLFNSLSNSAFSIGRPTLVWTTPQTFNVTRTLSHCSSSNTSNTATEGNPFSAVLTAENGYSLKASGASVVVTMGGTDVTSNVYNAATGEIAIASVNGNIVITATAAETTNIQIAYNIFGVTKGNSPTEIEENEDLEVVLTKGSDWTDYADSEVDLAARDILVYVNGKYLERKLNSSDSYGDFTATKSGDAVTINVPKEKITGNVVIMNIPWKAKYVCSKDMNAAPTTSSPAQSAGEVRITTTNTSIHTNIFLPVPSSCNSLEIFASQNTPTLAAYVVGCAFYDDASPTDDSTDTSKPFVGDSCVRGAGLPNAARTIDLTSQTIPSEASTWDYAKSGATRNDYVSFRTSCYTNNINSSNVGTALASSYIYDATNKKYIWFGNSVTKKTNR